MHTKVNPFTVMVDAYQATMFEQIPQGMENFQCSQLVHRKGLLPGEHKLVSAGLSLFTNWLKNLRVTQEDIDTADEFYSTFRASLTGKTFPWPKEIFQRVVDEFDGQIPIVVTGLPDGTAHFAGEPSVQVWTDVPGMGELVGWIESELVPYIWTSTVVATRGRIIKENFTTLYQDCYPSASYQEIQDMIAFKFHDFGRRGGADSMVTGVAHLMNWLGTDTCDAAYYAQYEMNSGIPFGACSIPAMAHRTVTTWPSEKAAYDNMIDKFGDDIHAIVADSYDFDQGAKYLAAQVERIRKLGGVLVVRPDSGDPVECVLTGLKELRDKFDHDCQEKGLKVIRGAAVIQGDGIDMFDVFDRILPATIDSGFCPSNVAFGMGQGNHQCRRSDVETAYKTCSVESFNKATGKTISMTPTMKKSNSDFKMSYPCPVAIDVNGYRVYGINRHELTEGRTGDLVVFYDGRNGKGLGRDLSGIDFTKTPDTFAEIRERTELSWNELKNSGSNPFDFIDPEIKSQQKDYCEFIDHQTEVMQEELETM